MDKKNKFIATLPSLATKNPKKFWRIVASLCLFLSCSLFTFFLFLPHTEFKQFTIMKTEVELALSVFSVICSIILIVKPMFFHIYMGNIAVWALLFIIDGGNTTGFILMTIAVGFAYKAGAFSQHKILDFLLFFVPTLLAVFSQFRFDKVVYIQSFIAMFGYIICIMILFRIIFSEYAKRNSGAVKIVLDLSKFNLTEEQIKLLVEVHNGKSYTELADAYYMSKSSVKRKLSDAYNELGVENMQDFLRKFGTADLVCSENYSIEKVND